MSAFNMNTWTQVAIDSYLYESTAVATGVDYVLSMKMTAADLFTSAHYKQDALLPELYDVKLELNTVKLKDKLLLANAVSISDEDADGVVNFTTPTTAGKALLEVMARKIFRHPKAAAAIANDSKYIGSDPNDLSGLISTNLGTTFNITLENQSSADATANTAQRDLQNLFESYVSLGRVNSADDISAYQPMVFNNGDKFTFPFYLKGQLYDDDGTGTALISTGAHYEDPVVSPMIGKDGGKGFISPGGVNSRVRTSVTLDPGQYEVPIRLDITIGA